MSNLFCGKRCKYHPICGPIKVNSNYYDCEGGLHFVMWRFTINVQTKEGNLDFFIGKFRIPNVLYTM